jgi:hypothetical protein
MVDQNRSESRIDKTLPVSDSIGFPVEIITETDLPGVKNLPICSVVCSLKDYWVVGHLKLLLQSVRVYIFPGEGALQVFAEFQTFFRPLLFPTR